MPEEKIRATHTNFVQNSTESQGVAAADSVAQAPQDVTVPVHMQQQPQPQNPFVVNAPAIPTQEGPMGIHYDFNDGARALLNK